jgi:hypothetical protein
MISLGIEVMVVEGDVVEEGSEMSSVGKESVAGDFCMARLEPYSSMTIVPVGMVH